MMNLLKNNKGITLVEVLIGTILFSMLVAAVSSVFVPLLRLQIAVSDASELNTLLDNAANTMISDIARSTKPLLERDNDNEISVAVDVINISINDKKDVEYTIDADGILRRNGELIYSKSYYKNKSITFTCTKVPDIPETKYILTMSVLSDDGDTTMIVRDYAIRPLILNQY